MPLTHAGRRHILDEAEPHGTLQWRRRHCCRAVGTGLVPRHHSHHCMKPALPRRQTAAEQAAYDRVCERLCGFDDSLHFESVDGLLCSLAAAPRVPPSEVWLPALLGDAYDRAFADPQDREQALRALESRLAVLRSELDPEALFDDPDAMRLQPLMAEWTDADREQAAAAGEPAAPQTGAEWAAAFLDGIDSLPALWQLPAGVDAEPATADFAQAREAVQALIHEPGSAELQAHFARHYAGRAEPTRDDLLVDAGYAVQDMRMLWVDHAPKPPTRRIEAVPGRNDPCPCGSGRKYKKCCGATAA